MRQCDHLFVITAFLVWKTENKASGPETAERAECAEQPEKTEFSDLAEGVERSEVEVGEASQTPGVFPQARLSVKP
jgi:hypothetical protein